MPHRIRKRLIIAAVCLLLLAGAAAGGVWLWRQGRAFLLSLKPRIEAALGSALSAEVKLGDITVSLYPEAGLAAKDIVLTPAGLCSPGAKIATIIFRLDAQALFEKRVVIEHLHVKGPQAALRLDGGTLGPAPLDGKECPAAASQTQIPPAEKAEVSSSQESGFSLDLRAVQIEEGKLLLAKDGTPHTLEIASASSALDLSAAGSTALENLKLAGALDADPLEVKAAAVEIRRAGGLQVRELALDLQGQKIELTGTLRNGSEIDGLSIASQGLDLPSIGRRLAAFGVLQTFPLKSGVLRAALTADRSAAGELKLSGELSLSQLNIPGAGVTLEALSLTKAKVALASDYSMSAGANVDIQGFRILDGKTVYQTRRCTGPLDFRRAAAGEINASGSLNVAGFGFDDGTTRIEKTDAALGQISALVDRRGGVTVTLNVDGRSITLSHAAIKISGAASVKAPLKIEVPAGGGYSVSGPVSIRDASLSTINRDFSAVSGDVDMLVTGPLRRFRSNNLSATVMGEKFQAQADFAMERGAYMLRKTKLTCAPMEFSADGRLERNAARSFAVELSARNIIFERVLPLINPQGTKRSEGTLSAMQASLKGSLDKPLDSLEGKGSFMSTEPIVKRFNLTAAIANAVAAVPLVGTRLVPAKLREDEHQSIAQANFTVAKRTATLTDVVIKRPSFTVYGSATLDFDLRINGRGSVVFMQESFSAFGGGFDALGRLLGRMGKVEIPLFVKGTYPDFSFSPDTATLLKDNSGLTLAGSALSTAKDIGTGIGSLITSPFRSSSAAPSPAPTP